MVVFCSIFREKMSDVNAVHLLPSSKILSLPSFKITACEWAPMEKRRRGVGVEGKRGGREGGEGCQRLCPIV